MVHAVPAAARSRWRRRVLRAVAWLCACATVLAGLLAGAVFTQFGLRTSLQLAQWFSGGTLQVAGASGRWWDAWQVQRFELRLSDLHLSIEDLRVDWRLPAVREQRIEASRLRAARVLVATPTSDEPAHLPQSLGLPVVVQADEVFVGALDLAKLDTSGKISAAHLSIAEINANELLLSQQRHRVGNASARTPWGGVRLRGGIDTAAPFALGFSYEMHGRVERFDASVQGRAEGTLAAMMVRLRAQGAGVRGSLEADVRPFDSPPLRSASVALVDLDPASFAADAPRAQLTVTADLQPSLIDGKDGGPQSWRVRGPLRIGNTAARTFDEGGLPIESLQGELDWDSHRLRLQGVEAQLAGGSVKGGMSWSPGADPLGQIDGNLVLQGVQLQRLVQAAQAQRIDGVLQVRASGQRQDFSAQLATTLGRVELKGRIQAARLHIDEARLTMAGAMASVQGELALTGARAFSLSGQASHIDPQRFARKAPPGDLGGRFSANGALGGAGASWQARAQLQLDSGALDGMPVRGRMQAIAAPGVLREVDGELELLGNQLYLQGSFGRPGDRLGYRLHAPALHRLNADFSGLVTADGFVGGTLDVPVGELNLNVSDLRLRDQLRLTSLAAQLKLEAGEQGSVVGKVDVGPLLVGADKQPWLRRVQLSLQGQRSAHELRLDADLLGDQKIFARLQGGLLPASWRGSLSEVRAEGPQRFTLLRPANVQAAFGESFGISMVDAEFGGETARLRLVRTEWSPQRILAKGDMRGVRVGFSLDENQRTVARGDSLGLSGEWDIDLGATANGQLRISREDGDIVLQGDAPVALGLSSLELILAATDNRLAFGASAVGSRLGTLTASGTALARRDGGRVMLDPDAPLLGAAQIEVPAIDWFGALVDQNMRTTGAVRGSFALSGTPAQPQASGEIRGERLGFALADQGLRLQDGELLMRFDANRVRIERLNFASVMQSVPRELRARLPAAVVGSPGSVSMSGETELASGRGRYALQAERVAVLQRPDVWVAVSGRGELRHVWQDAHLALDLRSDGAWVGFARSGAPTLSDDVVVRGRERGEARNVRLSADVGFDAGEYFYLKAYGIDAQLEGDLRIRRDDGVPLRASGSVRTRSGSYDAYGQRLEIERGQVNFLGPLDDPGLNILAMRRNLAVEAGVEITGTARRPRVRLVSEPNVPDSEKLSWIVLGRGSEVGPRDASLLLSAAGALLGGEGEGLQSQIARNLGIDDIRVGQSERAASSRGLSSRVAQGAIGTGAGVGGDAASQDQALTLGKRLGSDAYLSVEQNFLGTESIVKLSYALSRFLTLALRTGTDNAVDLSYSISFK